MKFFSLPALLAAALTSLMVVIPFLPESRQDAARYAFEARLTATTGGYAQLYYDNGKGFREENSARVNLPAAGREITCVFSLPPGDYRAFRLDPLDRDGVVTLESARVTGKNGRSLRDLALTSFQASNQIESLRTSGGRLEIAIVAGAKDPQLLVALDPVLRLHATLGEEISETFWPALGVFAGLCAVLALLDRSPALRAGLAQQAGLIASQPGRAMAVVTAIAVIASAYPVVFLGKSHVSPNMGTTLLYDEFPTLPGYGTRTTTDSNGSDIGAIMWQQLPYSMIQQRAIFRDGELPLFNRYNSAGTPLFDQGQSMFGDPLHFVVLAAGGSSWAWDLKYLLAKWLCAVGLALIVFELTRCLPAALLVGIAAPFAGFYLYRLNHPAFFSLSYAPWPLYCWVRFSRAESRRALAGWAAGLIGANWVLLTSGTVKEAYMLLLTMNFSGACVLASCARPVRDRLTRFGILAWAGVIFILLSAPVWLTFLDTLKSSYTSYDAVSAFQVQPGLLLGAFDELFYRPLTSGYRVFNPSASFPVLLGVLYFLATLRLHFASRTVLALAVSSLVPLALAFGLFPAAWIVRLPFLSNVAHLDNSFSCALILLWTVLAGVGFATAARRLRTPEGPGDLAIAGLLLFALVFAWIASLQTVHRSVFGAGQTVSFLRSSDQIQVAPFVWWSLALMLGASAALAVISRRALLRSHLTPVGGMLAGLCLLLLLWRGGLHAQNVGFEAFTARPTRRVDFSAESPAVTFVQESQKVAPSRVVGLQGNLFPGWSGAYGLEGISGPDALMSPYFRELTIASPVERLWDWRLYVSHDTVTTARPFLDFLNVRYYLDLRSDQAALGAKLKLSRTGDLDVYESPTVWPRAFFTNRLAVYDKPADLIGLIGRGDGRPFASIQSSEAGSAPPLPRDLPGRTIVSATDFHLTANTTSFSIRAGGPGVVVLTEVWWPADIRVELDGREAPLLRLNHAFRGVAIPTAGDHHVAFRYLPHRFPLAVGGSVFGLLLLAGSIILALRRPGQTPPAGNAPFIPLAKSAEGSIEGQL